MRDWNVLLLAEHFTERGIVPATSKRSCAPDQTFSAFIERIQDPATAWSACPRADWMFQLLRRSGPPGEPVDRRLRQFACWCVTDIGGTPQTFPALAAAEAFVAGARDRSYMIIAHEAAKSAAAGALTVGVAGWHAIACAQLASFHASGGDVLGGAEQASRFNALGRGFEFAADRAREVTTSAIPVSVRVWGEANRAVVDQVRLAALGRQAAVLRFILEQPFHDPQC